MDCFTSSQGHKFLLTRCCCCSLKTGVLIIAALEIVFCLSMIILLLAAVELPGQSLWMLLPAGVGEILELVAHILISSVLIYGVKKSRRHLVVGWLWMRSVVLMTDFIVFAVDSLFVYKAWFLFIISIVILVTLCYTMLIVRSYALTMTEAEEEDKVHLEEVTTSTHTRLQETED